MTVAMLKQRHRSVLDYVTAACAAALRGETAPSPIRTLDSIDKFMCPAMQLDQIGERLRCGIGHPLLAFVSN
jgi:hypothetical protein